MTATAIPTMIAIAMMVVTIAIPGVDAARLPQVEGDQDAWGTILNEYLLVAHDAQGYIRPNSISTTELQIGTITGEYLSNETITSAQVLDESLTGSDIMDGSIGVEDLMESSITGSALAEYAIDDPMLIADGVINGAHIEVGSITGTHIMDDAVTGDDIAPLSITGKHLGPDGVTGDNINDYTVTGLDVSPDAELNINSVEANYFYAGVTATSNSCETGPDPCTARIACPESTVVLFGMASSTSTECGYNPSACNQYCAPQLDSCEVYSETGSASVYIVCSRVV